MPTKNVNTKKKTPNSSPAKKVAKKNKKPGLKKKTEEIDPEKQKTLEYERNYKLHMEAQEQIKNLSPKQEAWIGEKPKDAFAGQSPLILMQIENVSSSEHKVRLFNQDEGKNHERIFINPLFGNITYLQMLKIIAQSRIKIGGIYMQVVEGNNKAITNPFKIIKRDLHGRYWEFSPKSYFDMYQFQNTVTYNNNLSNGEPDWSSFLDVTMEYEFTIPAKTIIQITLFPSQIVALYNYEMKDGEDSSMNQKFGKPNVVGTLS